MANLVTGALSSIIPKLYQLLQEEYNLQTSVTERISFLTLELELAQAALGKVAEMPWDQLDKQVQIWARKVREATYDMEDVLDNFLVRVEGPESTEKKSLLKHLKKMTNFFKKSKARRKISGEVKHIMTHLQEMTEQCRRYKVDDIVVRRATASTIDPRLAAMYTQVKNLVGMDKSSSDLISMLHNQEQGDVSSMKMKIVSIVGVGGLGKTTLAKAVYNKIKGDFSCVAFVPVGQNPDLKKVFKDILIDLDKQRYLQYSTAALDERQLIDELRMFFLENKRYLIVIDDIWEVESWETIKLAMFDDNDSEGRIIITTRKLEVATKADKVYKLQPLPYDMSRELLIRRISGHEEKYVHSQPDEILDKFIRKCSGIPLAIITMASLLVGKQREEWWQLYNTIDFWSKDNKEAEHTMKILSLSYYDLPSHLRTCLLYLSAFPEDSVILKETLVWMWVAEGFVRQQKRISLFEIGEGYFNDLINRSMIQPVESDYDSNIVIGCRVHDMVLDFICSVSREENFFTVLDADHRLLLKSNVRRLANYNGIIWHLGCFSLTDKLRSFIARDCYVETWVPVSNFTFLRVLAIENRIPRYDSGVRVEDLRHLLQLRFLSLRGTLIGRIPEEMGGLRFLQMLDLRGSAISEMPSSSCLPKLLACLRITVKGNDSDEKMFSVKGMTCLEELSIDFGIYNTMSWPLKDLSCLMDLRVLDIFHVFWEEAGARDLVESLGHLQKLQRLRICGFKRITTNAPTWQAMELVLLRYLRCFAIDCIFFCKLPSCINPSCRNLSHLDLKLECIDEKDLKILGALPELRYLALELGLWSNATIHNISDRDICYFSELRFCKLIGKMLFFFANKEDKSVSLHIWNGVDDISIPSVSDSDDELQRARPSVSNDELKSEDKLQSPIIPSVSHDDELDRLLQSIDGGGAAPCFMPRLQVLHMEVYFLDDIPNLLDNLGWERFSSLREINVDHYLEDVRKNILETMLRRAAEVHPNHPAVHINNL